MSGPIRRTTTASSSVSYGEDEGDNFGVIGHMQTQETTGTEDSFVMQFGSESVDQFDTEPAIQVGSPSTPQLNVSSSMTADDMIRLGPNYEEIIEKKSNGWLQFIFPCCISAFQRRHVILIGRYLYRYKGPDFVSLKGSPLPIEFMSIRQENSDSREFILSSSRKDYTFRCKDAASAYAWVRSLKKRQKVIVREQMGHSKVRREVLAVNQVGDKLFQKRTIREWQLDSISSATNPMLEPALWATRQQADPLLD
jgi:hypothetical protein